MSGFGGSTPLRDTQGDNAMDDANNAVRVNVIASSASGGDGAILDGANATIRATVTGALALKVDGSAVTQPVSGTVTANAGTNLNTSALALDTSVNGILVAQASTTSGEKGPLAQGAVTTAAPAYTTGQTDPLSLTTAGALRVDGSAVTQPVSGTVTANAGTNLNTSALALDTSVNGLLLAQASTTSGQKGPLVQGAVTTAAPTYTTAQTDPISLKTTGSLRTEMSEWIGSTAPTIGSKTSANSIPVVVASDQAAITVAQATAANLNVREDTSGATAAAVPARADYVGVSDGTNLRGVIATSATNLTTAIVNAAPLVASLATWNVNNRPVTATKATVTKAAGAAGVRHVVAGFSFTLAAGATAQTPLNIDVIDGASGGTTRLWTGAISCVANGAAEVTVPFCSLVGTAATGTTIEFSAAGATATLQAVTMWGYDVQ